jgi:formate dehydrogenase iron-sulfur subunit
MARTLAMFTDTSLCIGCRACQVACKQWNELPSEQPEWTGSYQNHSTFTDKTYRLVRFIEKPQANGELSWLLMSDVCKHCAQAGCLDACPTGAIYRTEFGTVNINQDVCNGCRYCVSSCPFGVVSFNHDTGRANKCTFCNDRIHNGLGPACAKTCPTESIQFGFRDELVAKAE